ncbi:hypothetical protein BSNK01_17990 [Bacillaceae bacterium]
MKQFAYGKMQNQINTLKYYLRSRTDPERERMMAEIVRMQRYVKELLSIEGNRVEDVRQKVLNCEALAAQHYWKGVKMLIGEKNREFPGRDPWSPSDPVNMMLNYGYGIIGARVLGAIVRTGLEPYAGFIHADRSGKLSLRYDLVEEFRAPIVDRVVLSMLAKGFKPQTEQKEDGCILHKDTRKHLKENLFKRLDAKEKYKGKEYLLKTIIQLAKNGENGNGLCKEAGISRKNRHAEWIEKFVEMQNRDPDGTGGRTGKPCGKRLSESEDNDLFFTDHLQRHSSLASH